MLALLGSLLLIAAGIGLHLLYATVAKKRWGAKWADPVTAILYRVQPSPYWSVSERSLHGFLWVVKRLGFLLIVLGVVVIIAAFIE